MKILIGIVAYNPDIIRLEENISAVAAEPADHILVFDNGSENIADIRNLLSKYNAELYENGSNAGIACALSFIMDYAKENNYDWVLTLDQDSVVISGLVSHYREFASRLENAALLSCGIRDRNFVEEELNSENCVEIDRCITSASLMNTQLYFKTSGYDKKMFIDYVDFDICYKLKEAGFKIYQIPFKGLLHEVGNGKNVSFLGKSYIVYNHSAFRKYYIARNSIYCSLNHPEFDSPLKSTIRICREMFFVLLYEEDKKNKLSKMFKGYVDGIRMKKG